MGKMANFLGLPWAYAFMLASSLHGGHHHSPGPANLKLSKHCGPKKEDVNTWGIESILGTPLSEDVHIKALASNNALTKPVP